MPRKTNSVNVYRAFLHLASMRPRPDAAENVFRDAGDANELVSFNEAAARCRGKHAPRE